MWLEDLGFNIGSPVLVKCEDGKLIITADETMAKMEEAEKAFMEEETRKLEARFQAEKKKLQAQFVAEQRANYGMVAEAGTEAAYV